jgi:hypothetical protein
MRDRRIGKRRSGGRVIVIGLLLLIAGCAAPNGSGGNSSGNSGNDRNSGFYGGMIGGGIGLP